MYNILCVDDTQANLFTLEALFEEYSHIYSIITVTSGHDALGVLLENKIDLILLDVMMPELDGFETAKLIKMNKLTKDIPIIFLTARRDNITIKNAFSYGVDYLSKPYDHDELFARIKSHLKLQEMQKQLKREIAFNQAVLDSQENIIFITTSKEIQQVNKKFLDFFNAESIENFKQNHQCICELFLNYDNYFNLDLLKEDEKWVEVVAQSHKEKEYSILLMDTKKFEPKAFKIDVNRINGFDLFVVSLTDITIITTKSKNFENKATYDALTNIYNRSKFTEVIDEHYKIFKRYAAPLSFAIFDIDFFKQVNDTYGHITGDTTLITFAYTINEAVRATDIFARWGGEEFVLLMPETKINEAVIVADKLRTLIEKTRFKEVGTVTCSVGVSQFKEDDTIDDILKRADKALYLAKENGRNKVCSK